MGGVAFRLAMRTPAAALIAALAALGASPLGAHAGNNISMSVSMPWQVVSGSSEWMPFQFSISNDTGSTFDGTVRLAQTQAAGGIDPSYQAHVTVATGTTKTLRLFAPPPNGAQYDARLVADDGSVADSSQVVVTGGRWAGVLSDDTSTGPAVAGAQVDPTLWGSVGVYAFTSAADLPPSAADLRGLSAIVIDGFDTEALSQSQLRVLRDYVGLGGSLVVVAGSDWRRTLAGLPADLVPLAPDSTVTVLLQPLAAMVGQSSDAEASVAVGKLADGARAVLSGAGSTPLIVEQSLGTGRVIELTFDPDAGGLPADLRAEAWGQAIGRGSVLSSGNVCCFKGGVAIAGPVYGGGSVTYGGGSSVFAPGIKTIGGMPWQAYSSGIQQVLLATGRAALPPAGLLFLLLLIYLAAAGPLNYFLLRRLGRRELAWVTVPLLAIVAAGTTYGFGVGRGGTVLDNRLEVALAIPGGGADVTSYDGVFVPHRGDFGISLDPGELAGGLSGYGGGVSSESVSIFGGGSPSIHVVNAAVWSETPLRTESVRHIDASVAADLSYQGSTVVGTITNTGSVTLDSLELSLPDGRPVALGGPLKPGAVLNVNQGSLSSPTSPYGISVPFPATTNGQVTDAQKVSYLEGLAQLESPDAMVLATFRDQGGLRIDGGASYSDTAILAQPFSWRAVDSPGVGWLPPRLVASAPGATAGTRIDVFAYELPSGLTSKLQVGGVPATVTPIPVPMPLCPPNAICAPGNSSPSGISSNTPSTTMQVYNPQSGTWTPLTAGGLVSGQPGTELLIRVTASGVPSAPTLQAAG